MTIIFFSENLQGPELSTSNDLIEQFFVTSKFFFNFSGYKWLHQKLNEHCLPFFLRIKLIFFFRRQSIGS